MTLTINYGFCSVAIIPVKDLNEAESILLNWKLDKVFKWELK